MRVTPRLPTDAGNLWRLRDEIPALRYYQEADCFFRIVGLMLAIAPLWLMLAAAYTSAHAQTPKPSPADWTQFHRDNMQRWNPYETVLSVNNVVELQLKWKNSIGANTGGFGFTSSPAVVNGVIYFGSDDGTVYALNASTGGPSCGAWPLVY